MSSDTLFEAFLNKHDEEAWSEILATLLPDIHEVDKTATQIWFYFFPLAVARALQQAEHPEQLAQKLVLAGEYYLEDQIDSSHQFLYGHRYWPEVKKAIIEHAASAKAPASLELANQIREGASGMAKRMDVDQSLLVGITAVGFMTWQQVGLEAFKEYPGAVNLDPKVARRSPEEVLKARAKDDRQPIFRFLKYPDKVWTVTFNENDDSATFKLINTQHVTTAAANDKRPYHLRNPRCIANEGPIPVQCRSASCGTCWVGILGGAEKLSEVGDLEARRIKDFGYINTDDPKPLIRLACQTQAFGAVSIVIPPWNGVFGKLLRRQKEAAAEMQRQMNANLPSC
ncbi:MAG: (2Fe-2S)-binding protein [Acidobacteria bacterium]|nr:(2Fe-2S)-binding protein [Acidobacteriota bacterium]